MKTAIRVCCPFCLAALAERTAKQLSATACDQIVAAHRAACPCWNTSAARRMHLED